MVHARFAATLPPRLLCVLLLLLWGLGGALTALAQGGTQNPAPETAPVASKRFTEPYIVGEILRETLAPVAQATPAALMALLAQAGFGWLERRLHPPGQVPGKRRWIRDCSETGRDPHPGQARQCAASSQQRFYFPRSAKQIALVAQTTH